MKQTDLITERDNLKSKLNWLGVRSTGSERIEKRLREIESEMVSSNGSFEASE